MARKMTVRRKVDTTNLAEAFNQFIFEKEALGLSERTIGSYKQSIRLFGEYHGLEEDTNLNDISIDYFYEWIKALKDRDVKPATINHYLRDNRTFFNWCMNKKYISNPFTIKLIKYQEESIKYFTEEEINKLLKKPDKNADFPEWRMWCVVCWILATGNRASTVTEIKLGDIDYTAKEITLRHTKNKKLQIIPLSPTLEAAIKKYCDIWRYYSTEDDYLFPNVTDEKMTTDSLRQAFTKYCKRRDVNRHNIHGLRHSFARMYIKNNGSAFALQKLLGHSTLDMTRKYVKLFAEDLKVDYELYSPLDNIKKNNTREYKVRRK